CLVRAGGNSQAAVRRKGYRQHFARVVAETVQGLAAVQVPELNRLVHAASEGTAAIWRNHGTGHRPGVPIQRAHFGPARRVPQPRLAIFAAEHCPRFVRAKSDTPASIIGTRLGAVMNCPAGGHVPQPERVIHVWATGEEASAIGTKGGTAHRPFMALE